jgi:sugar-specific transcriptional regulator TrmB
VVPDHTPDSNPHKFRAVRQNEIPKGREGKHKKIIEQLLRRIDQLAPDTALKVPLDALPDKKANIRSALNRATRKRGLEVATSSNSMNLYIWKVTGKSGRMAS